MIIAFLVLLISEIMFWSIGLMNLALMIVASMLESSAVCTWFPTAIIHKSESFLCFCLQI